MRAVHLYLGFKNPETAGYLLASVSQEERDVLGARKTVTTVRGRQKTLSLGDEGAEAEVAELAEEEWSFCW